MLFRRSLLYAGCLLLFSCGKSDEAKPQTPPPPKVTVAPAIQREIVEWDEFTGRLQSPESVEIRPRVSGYLESIHFVDGQTVKKGDLLFIIDPRPYQAGVKRAQAALAQAEAQAKLATTNLARAKELQERQAIAQQEFDTRLNDMQTANAAVAQAKALLTTAQLDLDFTHLIAPVSGRMSRYYVSVGNLISSGQSGEATLLTTIVSLDPLYCYFDVDEQSYLKYAHLGESANGSAGEQAENLPLEMKIGDEEGFPHSGRLSFVDNQVRQETSTIQMRGTFPNPDLKLTPGLFTRVRIPSRERHKATLIPDEAVGADQATQFVYVVGEDKKAKLRQVELGPLVDDLRVVRKGVQPGELVITNGLLRVRPEIEVQAEEASSENKQTAEDGGGKSSAGEGSKEASGQGGYSREGNVSADLEKPPAGGPEKKK